MNLFKFEPKNVALAIFYPQAIGKENDYIIAKKNSSGIKKIIYNQNKNLDINKDGTITVQEYIKPALRYKLDQILKD